MFLSEIPCHTQAKRASLRASIHVISIPTESLLMFGILNCNTFQRRTARCFDSAHNPTEKVSVRSSVPGIPGYRCMTLSELPANIF